MTLAVAVNDVSRLYGSFAALRRVTCSFSVGGLHVLRGENGAGKSTLLRILAGLITPTSGHVHVLGGSPQESRTRIAYMSHAPMLYDELTAMENLRYFAKLHAAPGTCGECSASPEMALRAVGFDHALRRPVGHLSQGMRQRVSMARALMSDPELLLLDEPFSNMDHDGAKEIVALLRDFLSWPMTNGDSTRRTVILTTHQYDLVRASADSVVLLRRGSLSHEPALVGSERPVPAAA